MKIGILGTGAYGLALASVFEENQCKVTMWTKFEEEKEELEKKRKDDRKLPKYKIPKSIGFTTNLSQAVLEQDLIVIAVPASFVDDIAKQLSLLVTKEKPICIASKGIEQDTCLFLSNIVERYVKSKHLAVLSGPSFAIDIVNKEPIGFTLATKSKKMQTLLEQSLANHHIKLRKTEDFIGVEICGAIKNVIALAAGMLEGIQASESTKAMFITESLHDIKALIKGLGGSKKTILSYAGFGDLLLTCTSTKSRNFTYGKMLGEKRSLKELEQYRKETTIEGLYTLESIYQLINHKKIKIPIIDLIYAIVWNQQDCHKLLDFLVTKE